MSPFGKKTDAEEDSVATDPALDVEVERLSALSLPQLAAEVMAKGFSSQYDPCHDGRGIVGIANALNPARPTKGSYGLKGVRVASRLQDNADVPGSIANQSLRLDDLVAEGMQVLERAGLVRLKTGFNGTSTTVTYATTRLGRAALERNAVERILGGGTL